MKQLLDWHRELGEAGGRGVDRVDGVRVDHEAVHSGVHVTRLMEDGGQETGIVTSNTAQAYGAETDNTD